MKNSFLLIFFTFFSVLFLSGCDQSSLDTAPVSGTVTLDGMPVADAGITFTPDGGGPISYATTDAQGKYSLKVGKNEGAILGSHKVVIVKQESSGVEILEDGTMGEVDPAKVKTKFIVPEIYSSTLTTPLKGNVPAENDQINFDLTSK